MLNRYSLQVCKSIYLYVMIAHIPSKSLYVQCILYYNAILDAYAS